MAKVKHNPDAKFLIDDGISKAEPFAKDICKKLRAIIFTAEPKMIEDWKMGTKLLLRWNGVWILVFQKTCFVCFLSRFIIKR